MVASSAPGDITAVHASSAAGPNTCRAGTTRSLSVAIGFR
jgi:hypothetical protein